MGDRAGRRHVKIWHCGRGQVAWRCAKGKLAAEVESANIHVPTEERDDRVIACVAMVGAPRVRKGTPRGHDGSWVSAGNVAGMVSAARWGVVVR